jgi:NAD dependent epimerase/dehydratase family enzyme
MSKPNPSRKEKRTFSLSRESLHFLESIRKKQKRASVSAVLDELIAQQRRSQEADRISASIASYYNSLTDNEVTEDRLWGQFAETQFPDEP